MDGGGITSINFIPGIAVLVNKSPSHSPPSPSTGEDDEDDVAAFNFSLTSLGGFNPPDSSLSPLEDKLFFNPICRAGANESPIFNAASRLLAVGAGGCCATTASGGAAEGGSIINGGTPLPNNGGTDFPPLSQLPTAADNNTVRG